MATGSGPRAPPRPPFWESCPSQTLVPTRQHLQGTQVGGVDVPLGPGGRPARLDSQLHTDQLLSQGLGLPNQPLFPGALRCRKKKARGEQPGPSHGPHTQIDRRRPSPSWRNLSLSRQCQCHRQPSHAGRAPGPRGWAGRGRPTDLQEPGWAARGAQGCRQRLPWGAGGSGGQSPACLC